MQMSMLTWSPSAGLIHYSKLCKCHWVLSVRICPIPMASHQPTHHLDVFVVGVPVALPRYPSQILLSGSEASSSPLNLEVFPRFMERARPSGKSIQAPVDGFLCFLKISNKRIAKGCLYACLTHKSTYWDGFPEVYGNPSGCTGRNRIHKH